MRGKGQIEGEVAELKVAEHLVSEGYRVSVPFGEYRYDFVVDDGDDLWRVQVKKANQGSSEPWKYRIITRGYDPDEVDIFAGYIPSEDTIFYEPFTKSRTRIRVNTKSPEEFTEHNREEANLVDEYTFERAVSKLSRDLTSE